MGREFPYSTMKSGFTVEPAAVELRDCRLKALKLRTKVNLSSLKGIP